MGSALRTTEVERELAASDCQSPDQTCDQGDDRTLAAHNSSGRARATQSAQAAPAVHDSAEQLRVQVVERLAAHRNRHGTRQAQASDADAQAAQPADSRAARIRAAVAERYAHTPSYRAMLAAEADRVIQQARAAAEVAAINAQAIARAQQRLLEAYDEHANREAEAARHLQKTVAVELPAEIRPAVAVETDLWPELDRMVDRTVDRTAERALPDAGAAVPQSAKPVRAANPTAKPEADRAQGAEGLTVRLYQDAARGAVASARLASAADTHRYEQTSGRRLEPNDRDGLNYAPHELGYARRELGYDRREQPNDREATALDEEIAFRQAPVFEEPAGPPVALPANLIEFPRQLIAARKARPRYAEGPLREPAEAAPGDGQLRIFEVEPEQISTTPAEADRAVAQWTSIWLDGPAAAQASDGAAQTQESDQALDLPAGRTATALYPASLARRSAAGAINFALVLTGLGVGAAGFVSVAGRGMDWPTGLPAVEAMRQLAGQFAQRTDLQPRSIGLFAAGCLVVLTALYYTAFAWFADATPGMRAVRIALCTFEEGSPTRRAARRRLLAALLSACPLGMGFAWASVDEQRLTWHDRLSRIYLRKY